MAGAEAMTSRASNLVPTRDETRSVRLWLLPWSTERGWWHGLAGLALVLATVRSVLFAFSHGPWFMNDSAEYLELTNDLFVPRTRPPGVAVFWWAVLGVWHSVHAVVVAQMALGIVSGLVCYCVAREVGLRTRAAFVVAVLASCTPTVLFFERVYLTETLALFLSLVTLWVALVALRTQSNMAWAFVGLVGAASVLVRTISTITLAVLGVVTLCLTAGSALRKLGAVLAFSIAAMVPLGAYSFAVYVDSRAITGSGHFGLQFTDGFAYFAATAPLTDCSHPGKPPAIRARICAVPGYLERDPDAITWAPGPVNDALRSGNYIERNEDLKDLAFENVRRDPVGYLGLVRDRATRLLSTYDNLYASDGRPFATWLEELDLPAGRFGDGLASTWPRVLDVWARVRLGLWLVLVVAVVLAPKRWQRGGREVVVLAAPAIASFLWICLAVTAVARYLVLFEPIAWIAAGWLVVTVLAEHPGSAKASATSRPEPAPVAS